jgi:hypothetical protein
MSTCTATAATACVVTEQAAHQTTSVFKPVSPSTNMNSVSVVSGVTGNQTLANGEAQEKPRSAVLFDTTAAVGMSGSSGTTGTVDVPSAVNDVQQHSRTPSPIQFIADAPSSVPTHLPTQPQTHTQEQQTPAQQQQQQQESQQQGAFRPVQQDHYINSTDSSGEALQRPRVSFAALAPSAVQQQQLHHHQQHQQHLHAQMYHHHQQQQQHISGYFPNTNPQAYMNNGLYNHGHLHGHVQMQVGYPTADHHAYGQYDQRQYHAHQQQQQHVYHSHVQQQQVSECRSLKELYHMSRISC